MKVRAKFKGGNSDGYVTGRTYDLTIESLSIERHDGTGRVTYQSIQGFLNN